MTISQRDSTKATGQGLYKEPEHDEAYLGPPSLPTVYHCILIMQLLTKILKTTNATFFDLINLHILAAIDIWLSVPKQRDKLKQIILHFKNMSNSVIFSIHTEYWTPYHNFESFQWYNIVKYNW